MSAVQFDLPARLPITAVYELKQYGRGFRVLRVFEVANQRVGANIAYQDGGGANLTVNMSLSTLKKLYSAHPQNDGNLCIMPYEYHLVAPSVPLLVVWRANDTSSAAVRAIVEKRPRTLSGDYYPQYEWIDAVPPAVLAKWREV